MRTQENIFISACAPRLSVCSTRKMVTTTRAAGLCALLLCLCACGGENQGSKTTGDDWGASAGPVVRSPAGEFRGSWMTSRRGRLFQAYRGIRYAEPPVGPLRFQPPVPITSYRSPVPAAADGPACPQEAAPGADISEDCLTINVYTPRTRGVALPVIVYFHAGGFYSMSGRSAIAGPHYLLDHDVVFVTLNHRIGSLGFLSLGTASAPGNVGFKDQVAALRWVQRNIAAFGGDPGLVTISGTSAGSLSVMVHMISPMSKGLFHRAISMSGSPTSKVPSPSSRMDLAIKQAKYSGCPTTGPDEIYQCLQTKTWQELAGSLSGFYEFGVDPTTLFRPVVEPDFGQERFLPIEPMDAIRQGKIHAVPYIISQTRDEFFWKAFTVLNNATLLSTMDRRWDEVAPISFVLPREPSPAPQRLRRAYLGPGPLANDTRTAHGLGRLYGDAITGFPVHRLANLVCRHSPQPVWYYRFDYIGLHSWYEDPVTKKPVGVRHHDDMLYLFSLRFRFPDIPADASEDSAMADRMTAMWYNFAKHGDPNPTSEGGPGLGGPRWPVMTPAERRFLSIGHQISVQEKLNEDRFSLWDELYPIQY